MAGCFGNHPVDKRLEQQLNNWLWEHDGIICEECGREDIIDDWELDEDSNEVICPDCGWKFNLKL